MSMMRIAPQISMTRSSSGGSASSTSQPSSASAYPARRISATVALGRSQPGMAVTRAARGCTGTSPPSGASTDCGSTMSRPAIVHRPMRRSATERAIGPSVRNAMDMPPYSPEFTTASGMRPTVGLCDAMPQQLERCDAAAVGRVAQRATDVIADADRRHARSERRRLATAGTTWGQCPVPGIPRAPTKRVCRYRYACPSRGGWCARVGCRPRASSAPRWPHLVRACTRPPPRPRKSTPSHDALAVLR